MFDVIVLFKYDKNDKNSLIKFVFLLLFCYPLNRGRELVQCVAWFTSRASKCRSRQRGRDGKLM